MDDNKLSIVRSLQILQSLCSFIFTMSTITKETLKMKYLGMKIGTFIIKEKSFSSNLFLEQWTHNPPPLINYWKKLPLGLWKVITFIQPNQTLYMYKPTKHVFMFSKCSFVFQMQFEGNCKRKLYTGVNKEII